MSKSNNDSSQIKFLSKVVGQNYVVKNIEMINKKIKKTWKLLSEKMSVTGE